MTAENETDIEKEPYVNALATMLSVEDRLEWFTSWVFSFASDLVVTVPRLFNIVFGKCVEAQLVYPTTLRRKDYEMIHALAHVCSLRSRSRNTKTAQFWLISSTSFSKDCVCLLFSCMS